MGGFLVPVISIIIELLELYKWIVIISVVASWLLAFGVITTANHMVRMALDVLYRLTEPVYRPIHRILPNFGGLDFTPFVVLILIWFIQMELGQLALQLYRF
jgi:YggT family protein